MNLNHVVSGRTIELIVNRYQCGRNYSMKFIKLNINLIGKEFFLYNISIFLFVVAAVLGLNY